MKHVKPLLALSLLLVSCAQKPIRIGMVGSIFVGSESLRGFQLAVAQANAAGGVNGRQVEVVHIDDSEDAQLCKEAVETILAQGIKFIVLQTSSGAAKGALPWAADQDALIVTREVSSPEWENRDDNLVRFIGPPQPYGQGLGAFALKRGASSLAIVLDERNPAYATAIVEGFTRATSALPILGELRTGDGFSQEAVADWIVSTGADSVLAILSSYDAALLTQQLAKTRYPGNLYLSPWSQNLLNLAGHYESHVFTASFYDSASTEPAYLKFTADYRRTFGEDPEVWAMFGYETAMVLFDAVRSSGSWNPMTVKRELIRIGTHRGLQQPFTLDAEGDAVTGFSIMGIRDGAYVTLE